MSTPQPPLLWESVSDSEDETHEIGKWVGEHCRGGEIILLDGPLGAGKTCLAGGVAEGLGINQPVLSPAFILMRTYPSPRGLLLFHLDFYRLGGLSDLETIGLEDCFGANSVLLVEWPSRIPEAFPDFSLALQMGWIGPEQRRIRALGGDRSLDERLRRLPGKSLHP